MYPNVPNSTMATLKAIRIWPHFLSWHTAKETLKNSALPILSHVKSMA
jgi:hypothetical protein